MPEALGECLFFRKPGIQTRPNVFCFWLGRATVARQTEGYLASVLTLKFADKIEQRWRGSHQLIWSR